MTDDDYWKRRYKNTWDAASKRESLIAGIIQAKTGRKVVPTGLGAGSAEFISGSAAKHGLERGAADLHVEDTNIYLEVTGPQSAFVKKHAALWVRPDKIDNAQRHAATTETWVVHCLADNETIRVIRLDSHFFEWRKAGQFPIVNPQIRGTVETYLEIAANHRCVQSLDVLIERIKQAL